MSYRSCFLLLILVLVGCNQEQKINPIVPNPEPVSQSLGLMEISLFGLNTQHIEARVSPYQDGISTQALNTINDGLDMKFVTQGSGIVAGRRYIYATFEVRNAERCRQAGECVAYTTDLNNATLVAVNTTTTLGNTAVRRMVRADNSLVDDASLAEKMFPNHAVQYNEATRRLEIINDKAHFQAFTEEEAANLDLSDEPSVVGILPWGFSIVNRTDNTSRTLPANPSANTYDGRVTFAFSYPDAATPDDDIKEISIIVQASTNTIGRVTEGIEEQGASQAETRADALNNSEVMLLGNSPTTVTDNSLQRICKLRYAGTTSAPLYLFNEDTGRCATLTTRAVADEGVNLDIPDTSDNSIGSLNRELAVSNLGTENIDSLTVNLDITHSYLWDLSVNLVSPNGTRVALVESPKTSDGSQCQSAATTQLIVTLDNDANLPVDSNCPFTDGTYKATGSLSNFAGENPNGIWTLEIKDKSAGDVGTLNNWGISFQLGKAPSFSQVHISQVSQNLKGHIGTVPLVADRGGMARAFLTQDLIDNLGIRGTPREARIYAYRDNTFVDEMLLSGPSDAYPSSIDESSLDNSFNTVLPATWFAPNTRFTLEITSDAGRVRYPSTGLFEPEILPNTTFNVSAVPIEAGGTAPPDVANNINTWLYHMQWLFPLPDNGINTTVTNTFVTTSTDIGPILNELEAKRRSDGSNNYYLGLYTPSGESSILGLANTPGKSSVVWPTANGGIISNDEYGSLTVAHEIGHNFGRLHNSGLCGARGLDTGYPHDNGIGAWGINFDPLLASRTFLRDTEVFRNPEPLTSSYSLPGHQDIMGYCKRQWVSDYTVEAVARYRATQDLPSQALLTNSSAESAPRIEDMNNLMLWGSIESDGTVNLRPAFRTHATTSALHGKASSYNLTVQLLANDGSVLNSVPIIPQTLDHMTTQHFHIVVPYSSNINAIKVVNRAGEALASLEHPNQHASNDTRKDTPELPIIDVRYEERRTSDNEARGMVASLWWESSSATQAIILRDPDTLEMIGYAEGDHITLSSDYGKDSIIVENSNGVSSQSQRVTLR